MDQPLETYQDEIYLGGLGGARPILPLSLPALEDLARERMAPESFDYICGGAGREDTIRENAAALRRWRIVPRMLTDVSAPSYASTVLGTELAAPILLGPVGVLKLAHPDGEVAVARAAAAAGVPMVLSTAASCTIEEVAEASGDGQRWFQLYWPKDRDVAVSFLSRATSVPAWDRQPELLQRPGLHRRTAGPGGRAPGRRHPALGADLRRHVADLG